MPSKSRNSGISIALALTACIIGIVAVILVSLWATNPKDSGDESYLGVSTTLMGYPGSENVFAWHPILMVGGFFVGQVLAINTWSIIPDHMAGKILHVLWQSAALACMIAGLTAVVKDKFNSKDPSLTSMHSWIGVCGIVMYVFLTALLPDSTLRTSIDWLTIHRFCGLTAIAISTSAISSGIMEQFGESGCFYNNLSDDGNTSIKADYNPAQHYHHIPGGCKIANGMGIAVLISTLLTTAAVIARNKAMGGNNSSLVSSIDNPIVTESL